MDKLLVRVLGTFSIDGLAEHEIGSRKARTLMKVLAISRRAPVAVDRIVEVLWRDDLPARPNDQVSVLVSRLRAVIGDRIRRTDGGYLLDYDWLDLEEFIVRTDEASSRLDVGRVGAARAAAMSALRLVTARALPDEDSEWADTARAEIDRLVARARRVGASAALASGAAGEAVALATAVLDTDPYDEAALRLLMRALAQTGRTGTALNEYVRLRNRLIEDFGVTPELATEAVHDELVLGTAHEPLPDAAHERVPSGLVGRQVEIHELDAQLFLTNERSRLVRIEGEPGIGKTTLVREWAATLHPNDALVLFARCAPLGIGLPLQPIVEAITEWLRDLDAAEVDHLLSAQQPLLVPLLAAQIGTTASSLHFTSTTPSITAMYETDAGRAQLFAALADVVVRGRSNRRLVMIVEDIHQCDPSTLAWLHFLVRRVSSALVLTTARPALKRAASGDDVIVTLGPLDIDGVVALVGEHDADILLARSGGNPLFLLELAQVADGHLPESIVASVRQRSDDLGPAAATLRVAALLGNKLDLDLLAACCRQPIADVLDHIELAVRHNLIVEQPDGLSFRHEVVRDALVAGTSASVRAFVHREASATLSRRPDAAPLETAHHAERAGAGQIASAAFVEGAELVAARFESELAEELLDRAIDLDDSTRARVGRARVRLSRGNTAGATSDINAALAESADSDILELAGWIAYYARDYATALRHAEQVRSTAPQDAVLASVGALEGRVLHSRGDLRGAVHCLTHSAMATPEPRVRDLAQIWLASVHMHQGHPDAAIALLDSARDTNTPLTHPFADGHAWMARCMSHGIAGRLADAFAAVEGLQQHASATGGAGQRFQPMAANLRAWLHRSAGNFEVAESLNRRALEFTGHFSFEEPACHARLDLVDIMLHTGRLTDAAESLDELAQHLDPASTMAWHQRQRLTWLTGRLALAIGDGDAATRAAREVTADATDRGSHRYAALGRHLDMMCSATAGTSRSVDELVHELDQLAGLDTWWLVAELATMRPDRRLWSAADERAKQHLRRCLEVEQVDHDVAREWIETTMQSLRSAR